MKILKICSFLASMKAGLIILISIGVVSAIGSSFIPENFYHSYLFKLLLILLLINMTLCTITQLIRYIRNKTKVKDNKPYAIRKIGILLLHAGIVLILIGGTINAFDGQSLPIKIVQGETLDIDKVIPKAKPFSLRLNKFYIEFNADGSPSQYYSDVSMIEGGSAVQNYSISVNNPLNYGGVKAYQSSFGYLVDVQGESDKGWNEKKSLAEGDAIEVQGTDKAVMIYKYIPNYDPQYGMNTKTLRPDNPRVIYSIYQKGAFVDVGLVAFGEKAEIEPGVSVFFDGVKPYTVLTAKRDPGLWLVGPGGLMLMIGVCLALFRKANKQGDVQ